MGEIKFRAWDKKNKVMMDWEDIKYIDLDTLQRSNILLQYVGLKDKNNKEIYEKDIIKDKNGGKWILQWNDVEFCYDVLLIGKIECWKHLSELLEEHYRDIRVIGNIYENPELLR